MYEDELKTYLIVGTVDDKIASINPFHASVCYWWQV